MVDVQTGLEALIERQLHAVEQNTRATTVTNVLVLAGAMSLDPTDPVQRRKVIRQLELIETDVQRRD